MDLNQEIRKLFANSKPGSAILISGLDADAPAWVVRMDGEYGVAVQVRDDVAISERFSSARLWTADMAIESEPCRLLLLTCQDEDLRLEFAALCAQLVDPGKEGAERKKIVESPFEWWVRWRDLLGNSISEKTPHAVLGELLTVHKLLQKGERPEWTGGSGGVNDIVCGRVEFEVKSTTMRYESIVTISGQFQLKHKDTDVLSIVFCRFEENSAGVSIDDVVRLLIECGYNAVLLEKTLCNLGFEAGSSDRRRKYNLLEMRRYLVDGHFPCITPASFIGGTIPPAIVQITYRLDLTGLEYENWT